MKFNTIGDRLSGPNGKLFLSCNAISVKVTYCVHLHLLGMSFFKNVKKENAEAIKEGVGGT
jgi:hypothetical protein